MTVRRVLLQSWRISLTSCCATSACRSCPGSNC